MGAGDLAELLRSLKERSGLSYGVLAKRLHVSTSTLHRYCSGAAVPAEFAPVERLARLCRATPEELMEVHRRWIVADATRGRKQQAESAAPPEAASGAPFAAPPEGPSSATPSGVRATSAEAETASPGTAAARSAEQAAPSAAEAARSGAKAEPSVAPRERATASPWRPGRRVVLTAVSAAVVAAVLGSAALAVTLGHDGSGSGQDAVNRSAGATAPVKAGERGASGKPGTGRGPGDGATPSPDASAASGAGQEKTGQEESGQNESSSSSGGEKGGGTRGAPGSEGGKGNGSEGSGVPLTAHVRPYAYESPCSQHYLVNRQPGAVPVPPTEPDAPGWVSEVGAVAAGEQFVKITLQGTGKETVVLEGLHVRVQDSKAPLAWNEYLTGVGCGGDVSTRSFGVDLDAAQPAVTPGGGQRAFPYKVSEADPEVFYVKAGAKRHDVTWHLEVEWSSGSRRGVLRIDDRGRPFRTSGAGDRPSYQWPPGGRGWEQAPRAGS
ncbi:helix-turn-helix domain-containing protein [Streptomyces sp. NPDC008001]|uniref:helix-turn-helix domain-containing protein n=1 Tax=Streptomyces sp. NPDC008001 TaxID=3364804 RepID=UPI0036E2A13B